MKKLLRLQKLEKKLNGLKEKRIKKLENLDSETNYEVRALGFYNSLEYGTIEERQDELDLDEEQDEVGLLIAFVASEIHVITTEETEE